MRAGAPDCLIAIMAAEADDGRAAQVGHPTRGHFAFDAVAEQLSGVLGRGVAFVPVADGVAVAQLIGAGVPEWFATNVVTQFRLLRQGAQDQANDTITRLTGRAPRPLAAFLRDHAGAFA